MQGLNNNVNKWLSTGLLLASYSIANAAQTNLGSLGNTQLQQDTGDAVQITCGGFVNEGTQPGTVPLFDTCRAMVHTGNDVADNSGPTRDSLGLTQDELAASLQQIATEEFAATKSMSTEISSSQMNASITRLVDLRSGVRGFSVVGLLPANSDLATLQPITGAGAGDDWSKLGGFFTATYGDGDRDGTDRTNEFDFDSYSLTAGLDYRLNDNFVMGAALSYYDVDSDFDEKPTVSGGDVDADGWGGFLYGTYYVDQAYIDGMIGYSSTDYDSKRNIIIPSNTSVPGFNQVAKGSTDSDDFSASLGAGYDFVDGALTYGPYARISYLKVDIDDYTEKGAEATGLNLNVDDQEWKSLTSVLGAKFAYSVSKDFGVLIPQGNIGWIHEYENDSEVFTATYVADPRQNILKASTNSPDRDYFELGIGVSAVLKSGVQLYASYDTILEFDDLTSHLISVGGRWEF